MLRTLQKHLQKVFIVFVIGMIGTIYAMRLYVWPRLESNIKSDMTRRIGDQVEIVATTPFDVILMQVKIGIVVGIVLAIPVLLYLARDTIREQSWYPEAPVSLWKLFALALVAGLLCVGGIAYGYFLFFPIMFDFLATNAVSAGIKPHYSIVEYTEFVLVLTLSFGLAAELPLAMSGLGYSGIVPYETFRDKWRYAVVAIFAFGALFSPPDPFTQIMWAAPLLVLYGASLYLTKLVVNLRRGSEQVGIGRTLRTNWSRILGITLLVGLAVFAFFTRGGLAYVNENIARHAGLRLTPLGPIEDVGVTREIAIVVASVTAAAVAFVGSLLSYLFASLEAGPAEAGRMGDPTAIDVGGLDAAGVRAAPPQAFAAMDEETALGHAQAAIDAGDDEKARAILDRFDESQGVEAGGDADSERADTASRDAAVSSAIRGSSSGEVDRLGAVRSRWNRIAGAALLAGAAAYAFVAYGGVAAVNERLLPRLPAAYRPASLPDVAPLLGLPESQAALAVGAGAGALALLVVAAAYAARARPLAPEPDVDAITTADVRAASPAAFADISESQALQAASAAKDAGDVTLARAILDRYDEAEAERQAAREAEAEEEAEAAEGGADEGGNVVQNTAAGMMNAFTEDETTEDDIGGYYYDIAFVFESLTSKMFRIVAVFMIVLAGTFIFLYQGGLGRIRADFLARIPEQIASPEEMGLVALHPVEALVFEVKVSAILAGVATLPFLLYYAWPALEERGFATGDRGILGTWGIAIVVGLVIGTILGYVIVAPAIISYLVFDAIRADMVISYRLKNFFWLVFMTTAGVGLLADIPITMLLFYRGGIVTYRTMRRRWREVAVGIAVVSALVTPDSLYTMFIVGIPSMIFYGIGLGLLWIITLGGRRERQPTGSPDASD